MTPEQRIEHAISERTAGLWARWYESGPHDALRGWWHPEDEDGKTLRLLSRERIRALVERIGEEYR